MNETTNEVVEEIVEKSDAAVVETQVAPEAIVEESLDAEKAMKPHADEETPAEDAGEKPADETEEDKAKKSDDVQSSEAEVSEKSDEVIALAVTELKDSVTNAFGDLAATLKSLSEEVADLKKSLDATTTDVNQIKGTFNEIGKRVDAVELDTAFRKSGDLGEIVQEPVMVQKSLWGGRFLKSSDLYN